MKNYDEIENECRHIAKKQGMSLSRSKTTGTINGYSYYVLIDRKNRNIIHRGSLLTIYEKLLSGC